MEYYEIEEQLTIDQKAAIISILIIKPNADRKSDVSERLFITSVCKYLIMTPNNPNIQKLLASSGKVEIMRILNTLSRTQKEWLVTLIHSIVIIDGIAEDIEISYALGISKDIGISESEFVNIIETGKYLYMINKM